MSSLDREKRWSGKKEGTCQGEKPRVAIEARTPLGAAVEYNIS
jgi:hypothetical protein